VWPQSSRGRSCFTERTITPLKSTKVRRSSIMIRYRSASNQFAITTSLDSVPSLVQVGFALALAPNSTYLTSIISSSTLQSLFFMIVLLHFNSHDLLFYSSCSSKEPVTVTMVNPEFDSKAWSSYPNLAYIELKFRRIGNVEWHSALNPSGGRIYVQTRVPAVRSIVFFSSF
jgi:hypothetical protein